MSRFSIDPPDEDAYEVDDEREDEAWRERMRDEFIAHCRGFSETEGWSGVIRAVSIAMTEQAAREDEARRLEQVGA